MGEVYRARDLRLERDVAIKVLPESLSSDPSRKQRLEREAKSISKLSHPHVCALYDIGYQDGAAFLVMELVEGETLDHRLKKGPLPPEQTIRLAAQIAAGLGKAHQLGIVHRDLKPGNVMLTRNGAKLLDFGLAKHFEPVLGDAHSSGVTIEKANLTEEGALVGTFQYMAPEQLEGKEADGRTDIFALGEVMYEMATGRQAFSGESRASLIASIMRAEPKPMTELQPMTPPGLERVVKKCLAKDPEDRWQSASDLASELSWLVEAESRRGNRRRASETGPPGMDSGGSVSRNHRSGLVEHSRTCSFSNVFPCRGAVSCERPRLVSGRAEARHGGRVRAGELLRALDVRNRRPARDGPGRDGGSVLSLLVFRRKVHRVLRRRQAQESGRLGWAGSGSL